MLKKLLHKEAMKVQTGNETCSQPTINIHQAVLQFRAVFGYTSLFIPGRENGG
jgi:hypothetical protein